MVNSALKSFAMVLAVLVGLVCTVLHFFKVLYFGNISNYFIVFCFLSASSTVYCAKKEK